MLELSCYAVLLHLLQQACMWHSLPNLACDKLHLSGQESYTTAAI